MAMLPAAIGQQPESRGDAEGLKCNLKASRREQKQNNDTLTKRNRFTGTGKPDWPPHEESNLDFRFRRPVFYPLNYGEAKDGIIAQTWRLAPSRKLYRIATSRPSRRLSAATRPMHYTGCGCIMNQPRNSAPAITQYTPNAASRPRPSK